MTGLGELHSIFGNQGTQGSTATTDTQTAGQANGAGKVGETMFQGIDRSALSATAHAVGAASPDSDVRMDKVQQLQAAIASGSYNIPSSAIADKLMQTMLGA